MRISKLVNKWLVAGAVGIAVMRAAGRLQESWNDGVTSVSLPASRSAYRAGSAKDVYVEFDVPASSVRAADGRTGKIYGPNSSQGKLLGIQDMPP
jgi:hypothetical protein